MSTPAKHTPAALATLASMPDPDTAYTSASVAHRRWGDRVNYRHISGQARLLRRMREAGLVDRVNDYSGDLWCITANGRAALATPVLEREG